MEDTTAIFWTIISFFVLIAVIIGFVYSGQDCLSKSCPTGQEAAMIHYQCICVTRPK